MAAPLPSPAADPVPQPAPAVTASLSTATRRAAQRLPQRGRARRLWQNLTLDLSPRDSSKPEVKLRPTQATQGESAGPPSADDAASDEQNDVADESASAAPWLKAKAKLAVARGLLPRLAAGGGSPNAVTGGEASDTGGDASAADSTAHLPPGASEVEKQAGVSDEDDDLPLPASKVRKGSTTPLLQLAACLEDDSPCAADPHSLLAVVSVSSLLPELPPGVDMRPPVELVAVVDNSSSMGGEKLGAIQESLSYVVRHALRPCDRLGLISYDDEAQAICEPMAMDAMGRRLALMSINAMHALGKTNMSSGLLEGCKMIRDSAAMSRPPSPQHSGAWAGATRAVLLFSDAKANRGVTEDEALVTMAHEMLDGLPQGAVRIFAIGVGEQPNESQMRRLAGEFHGHYHRMAEPRDIFPAMSSCLDTLLPAAALDVTLKLRAVGGMSRLGRPLQGPGGYECTVAAGHSEGGKHEGIDVHLGSLYSLGGGGGGGGGDGGGSGGLDLLIPVYLPRLDQPLPKRRRVLEASLHYRTPPTPPRSGAGSPPNSRRTGPREVVWAEVTAERPTRRAAEASALLSLARRGGLARHAMPVAPLDMRLDEHCYGIGIALAIDEATQLCLDGRFDLARLSLRDASTLGESSVPGSDARRLLRIDDLQAGRPRAGGGLTAATQDNGNLPIALPRRAGAAPLTGTGGGGGGGRVRTIPSLLALSSSHDDTEPSKHGHGPLLLPGLPTVERDPATDHSARSRRLALPSQAWGSPRAAAPP